MGTWSCRQCTLANDIRTPNCNACGARNPELVDKERTSFLPKIIAKPIEDLSNAVCEIFSIPGQSSSPQWPQAAGPYPPAVPPRRPAPPRPPVPKTSPSSEELKKIDYTMNWICKQCYNINNLPEIACKTCGCNREIGAKRKRKGPKDNHGAIVEGGFYSQIMEEVEQRDAVQAMQQYDHIVATCNQHNTNFVDDSFPHTMKSIGELKRNRQDAVVGELPQSFVWLRPQNIYTRDGRMFNWAVFRDPQPSDIEQGVLGDCWLLSALALIAERPDILMQIFLTREYSPFGAYQLRICIDGEWKVTVVDDFFPCRAHSRALAFGVGRKNQLWVPLIEKALAKQLGNYSKLSGGRTIEGLAMLTGAPCEQTTIEHANDPSEKDMLWVKLLSAREAGFILGCSCGSGNRAVDASVYKAKGLLVRHAYSILEVKNEGGHRLLRIRNPWGTFVWNGAWSDSWPKWDPILKARLLNTEIATQTGAFWMSFDDFVEHFDAVDIAKIRTHCGWSELRLPIKLGRMHDEWDKAVRFFVEEPTEMCFTLFQSGSRTQGDLVDLLICVHRMNPNETVGELMFRSPRKVDGSITTGDIFLGNGEYIALCHSFSTLGAKKINGCVVIHSSRPIYADQLAAKPGMYTDSLVQTVLKDGTTQQMMPGVIPRYLSKNFSGLLLMVDNLMEDRWAHVRTQCSGSTNVLSSRGALDVADVVPPLSRQIIIILTHFEHTQSYYIQHQLNVSKTKRQMLEEGVPHFPLSVSPAINLVHATTSIFN